MVTPTNEYFSQFDIASAYNHIKLHDDFKQYCRFIGPRGRVFEWQVMPFGIASAPTIWNGVMERIVPDEFIYFFDNIAAGHAKVVG